MSSKVWIVRSNCPSVWGWYAVLSRSLVPKHFCKHSQNWDVNLGSLSKTILTEVPYNLTISFMYNWTSLLTGCLVFMGRKWADFFNLSTITHITSFPVDPFGNPITKSIVMCSHFHSGISRGWSFLVGFDVRSLFFRKYHIESHVELYLSSFLATSTNFSNPYTSWWHQGG